MGSQIWSVVVTMAWVATMALMDASMTSLASVAPRALMALASVAWRKLCNEMQRFSPMEIDWALRRYIPGLTADPEVRDGLALSK